MITAAIVKELRERTGAGMMDCKRALGETDGDMEKAIDFLREKGLAAAAKKSGRVAAEGLVNIKISEDGKTSAIVEVNAETDFVAKNAEFVEFVNKVTDIVLAGDFADVEALLVAQYDAETTVDAALKAKIAKIGENMNIRRFVKFDMAGTVAVSYTHGNGKIGVLTLLETPAEVAEVYEMGRSVAMQIASMNPQFIDESEVDPEYIEREKTILIHQALNEGKPENIVEKMVAGRLKKELKETCLLEQKFVKDGEVSVQQYIANFAKEIGKAIKVVKFVRYEVGEGIEKREDDLAAEVAKMTNK